MRTTGGLVSKKLSASPSSVRRHQAERLKRSSLLPFREALLSWWGSHHRAFPWRSTRDPYKVLIAEVLLHRTRARQVVPLYRSFVAAFRSVRELAEGDGRWIARSLRSAGLHWRVKLLQRMARDIWTKYGGRIPKDRTELEALPGVGPYIAGAVRCFAFGEADELIDTNTVRIASRLFGVTANDSSRRTRLFRELTQYLLDRKHPRQFNLALLDLGALICLPRNPSCHSCPVVAYCTYGRRKTAVRRSL